MNVYVISMQHPDPDATPLMVEAYTDYHEAQESCRVHNADDRFVSEFFITNIPMNRPRSTD